MGRASITQSLQTELPGTSEIDRAVGIESTAEYLGLSPWNVRRMIEDRRIKRSYKIGTRRLVPQSEIQRLLKESER